MVSPLLVALLGSRGVAAAPPVKVFILAGQSNMVGHGFIAADPKRNGGKGSLEWAAKNPETKGKYGRLLKKDGSWIVRDDVWIHAIQRKGMLTVGFGAGTDCIGPELGFGMAVGDSIKEPILLVKLAWGGKSLAEDFRPPSSGGKVGAYYTNVVSLSKELMSNMGKEFPELAGRKIQLTGFGWHQGWNDRVNTKFVAEYERNMANFIRDIRKDLKAPSLPFVIAETGMGGLAETDTDALALMRAQEAVAGYPEFKSNVAFVGTRGFWRTQAESPSSQDYHWNSNAETYYQIGESMGEAMKNLLKRGKR